MKRLAVNVLLSVATAAFEWSAVPSGQAQSSANRGGSASASSCHLRDAQCGHGSRTE